MLQELGARGWESVAQRALNDPRATRSASFLPDHGIYQLRAYLADDRSNVNSYSSPVTIDVNGIFKIKHVVIIMQENRSFDQYFGTFPGADGIPGLAGNPGNGAVRRPTP